MKNTKLFLILILFIISSCTKPEPTALYKLAIKNLSDSNLSIKVYHLDEFIFEETLLKDETGINCEYNTSSFWGYYPAGCNDGIDSLKFEFENGRGYLIALIPNKYDLSESKSPFNGASTKYVNKIGNEYIYEITQEDYENAFELPSE